MLPQLMTNDADPRLEALPVFYRPEMVADSECFSPSAAKPAAVVERWQQRGEVPICVQKPEAVTVEQIKLAHDTNMVDEILALRQANGFGNWSAEIARSLLYTSGAMLAASKEAIRNRAVAIAPTSGFHHAGHNFCGGFCTFNGLIIAAQVLLHAGEAQRIGILDFDHHYGDGTDDCIEALGLVRQIHHYSAGRWYRRPHQVADFLDQIPSLLDEMSDCDLVLYQAGADPHIDDPLGGWMTSEQLRLRDDLVFQHAAALKLPIAWNVAGGYQEPFEKVLAIHDQTLEACARVYLE